MTRRYFIAYATEYGGIGNTEIKRKGRIRSIDDVKSIERELSDAFRRDVTVIGWHRWR